MTKEQKTARALRRAKRTKRTFVASVVTILLCMTMLIGATFAWFTDNTSTSVNTIQAGRLQIELVDTNGKNLEGETLKFKKAPGAETEDVLFEPGVRYEIEDVYVKNAGTLALKYMIEPKGITAVSGAKDLNDVLIWEIKYGDVADSTTEGHLKAGERTVAPIEISVTMDPDANNDYQGLSLSGVAITVKATQDTVEHDSIDDQYDKDAKYEENPDVNQVGTMTELKEELEKAANGGNESVLIELTRDFDLTNWTPFSPKGYSGVKSVTINGNGHTLKNLDKPFMIGSFSGNGSISINNLIIENATIDENKYNGLGLGAFIAYSDASGSVSFSGCKLVESNVNCKDNYAGGLIGYSSSQSVSFTNCSVENSTITGSSSTGAFIGHSASETIVNGGSVIDCTLASADPDGWRVGVVAGTLDSRANTFTGLSSTNNSRAQTGKEPTTEELYGRLVNGATIKVQ